jgi:hypothetical protein
LYILQIWFKSIQIKAWCFQIFKTTFCSFSWQCVFQNNSGVHVLPPFQWIRPIFWYSS